MANGLVQKQTLQDIANAIRNKNQEVTTYKPSEMAAAINAIASDPKDIALDGNSYQFTTSGKNLLNISDITSGTTNGVSYVNNGDGTITFNGTATNTIYLNLNFNNNHINLVSGNVYSFGIKNANSGVSARLRLVSPNVSIAVISAGTSEKLNQSCSYTTEAFAFVEIANGTTLTNYTILPMVTSSAALGEYEPYTGGIASPNPDYPQEVEVVEPFNIIDLKDGTYTENAITANVSNNEIVLNGTTSATTFLTIALNKSLQLVSGNKYTITTNNEVGNSNIRFRIDINGTHDTYLTNINAFNTITYSNATLLGTSIQLRIASGQNLTNFKLKIQIVEGENILPFVPYNNIGVNVLGKNLIGYDGGLPYTNSGITLSKGTNSYNISGTSTGWFYRKVFTIPAGTLNGSYKFKKYNVSGTSLCFIRILDRVASPAATIAQTTNETTFSITNNHNELSVEIATDNTSTYNENFNIQLQLSSIEDTSYTPYSNITIPVPLNNGFIGKIGDTKDILNIDLEAGIISKLKNIGKVVLDGSETWIDSGYNASAHHYTYQGASKKGGQTNLISNKFITSVDATKVYSCVGNANNTNITLKMPLDISNTTQMKTWLSSNNTTMYYELATPTTEVLSTIDQTTLTNFRNTLKNNGTLTIYSNLDPSQIRITYGYTKTL